MRFVADVMLGKLAKWLRVLGHDTYYQSYYSHGKIEFLIRNDRRFLSRRSSALEKYDGVLLIESDRVEEQLKEINEKIPLFQGRILMFGRCLICNVELQYVRSDIAREDIPEYVFYEHTQGIKFCPSCKRFYWPGTHRERMERQLEAWGILS